MIVSQILPAVLQTANLTAAPAPGTSFHPLQFFIEFKRPVFLPSTTTLRVAQAHDIPELQQPVEPDSASSAPRSRVVIETARNAALASGPANGYTAVASEQLQSTHTAVFDVVDSQGRVAQTGWVAPL